MGLMKTDGIPGHLFINSKAELSQNQLADLIKKITPYCLEVPTVQRGV